MQPSNRMDKYCKLLLHSLAQISSKEMQSSTTWLDCSKQDVPWILLTIKFLKHSLLKCHFNQDLLPRLLQSSSVETMQFWINILLSSCKLLRMHKLLKKIKLEPSFALVKSEHWKIYQACRILCKQFQLCSKMEVIKWDNQLPSPLVVSQSVTLDSSWTKYSKWSRNQLHNKSTCSWQPWERLSTTSQSAWRTIFNIWCHCMLTKLAVKMSQSETL